MIGVVADDITGSNDIGIMFAKAGWKTDVYPFAPDFQLDSEAPEVLVLDTNSRLDERDDAYRKVFEATRWLKNNSCRLFINKSCSVFRGNIGAEFDAMLDALGENFAVVVLGFPKNGRTTLNGIHYVRGVKLEESEFRRDPVHPMTRSDLKGILQEQTDRTVDEIHAETIGQGPDALRQAIGRMKREGRCHYLILDVPDQASLGIIAEAVDGLPVLCGSSALAEELALRLTGGRSEPDAAAVPPLHPELGILVAAGSLMPQTASQIDFMKQQGYPVFELKTSNLFDEQARQEQSTERIDQCSRSIREGRHTLIHTSNQPDEIALTKARGEKAGLAPSVVSRLVSDTLAEIVAGILAETGQDRLVVAGGETSAAVSGRLGVRGMRVWKEIAPGLPSCITLTRPRRAMVLKSGSFGQADFFDRAIRHLQNM